jgi:hypothetical protein
MSGFGKNLLGACALALAVAGASGPAPARTNRETFESLQMDGLRLGMTPRDVEAIIHSRADVSEPYGDLQRSYDCDELYPATARATYDPGNEPQTPASYGFSDSAHHRYFIQLDATPGGAVATHISHQEHRAHTSWAEILGEAEQRYGRADLVRTEHDRSMTAVWCESSGEECTAERGSHGRVSMQWVPHGDWDLDNGDSLVWQLEEGDDRQAVRSEHYRTLAARRAGEVRRAFAACHGRTGKYADRQAFEIHLAALMSNMHGGGPYMWSHERVPAAALLALGMDEARTFGRGVCFSPSVIVETPGCDRYTFIRFRWARRIGDTWIVALRVGGASLRRYYQVVRKEPGGTYRRIWSGDSLAPYAAWAAAGATPMVPEE